MDLRELEAIVLDLDGVITRTEDQHARAWKETFDALLKERAGGEAFEPFDIERDYRTYVDGRPRLDGVRGFLAARGIDLEEGSPDDPPGAHTVYGVGGEKNRRFQQLLEREGVQVYDDAVAQLRRWRERHLRTAVVSSSRNCVPVLEAAGLGGLFDAKVDGNDKERLGLSGKPAPDLFLEATRQLGVAPSQAIMVEDAVPGVEAGRAGSFGRVIGVSRDGEEHARALLEHGADQVVRSLDEVETSLEEEEPPVGARFALPALEHLDKILATLGNRRPVFFLDYDGTLTPIVPSPERATLSEGMRQRIKALAERWPVAVVSGRDRRNVEDKVQLEGVVYAGSHGFDIRGPGLELQNPDAVGRLPELDAAERELRERLEGIHGVEVERKRFSLAVHYRQAASSDVGEVERNVDEVLAARGGLRKRGGKKIFELQPDVEWDKGHAVFWLLERLDVDPERAVPLYLGDDVTDEDAFRALRERGTGIGIRVGAAEHPTHAAYYLRGTEELECFLDALTDELAEEEG